MKIRHITLVPFTDANGDTFFVNPEHVAAVRPLAPLVNWGGIDSSTPATPRAAIDFTDNDLSLPVHGITAGMAAHALTSADIVAEAEP